MNVTIQNYRFVSIFTQILPLAGVKLGLDLSMILKLYSIAFPLFYFVCYVICGSWLKDYVMALALLCVNLLFSTDTFFWIQSELPQGLAIMMVTFSLLYKADDTNQIYLYALAAAGIVTAVFAHPLLLFPFLFVTIYTSFDSTYRVRSIVAALLFILLAAYKYFFLKTPYDSIASDGINNFSRLFPNYFTLYSNKRFLLNVITKYHFLIIAFSLVIGFFLRNRDWKRLSLTAFFFFGYLLLINVSYPHPETTNFYIENLYLPLSVIVAIPFFNFLSKSKVKSNVLAGIAAAIVVCCFLRIALHNTPYTKRLNWLQDYVSKFADQKQIVDSKNVPSNVLLMTWATPYEIWLLSTTERHATASIVITDRVQEYLWAKDDPQLFITTWGFDKYETLPKQYFIMKDSVSSYEILE